MKTYTENYFNFLLRENKMLIESWEEEIKHCAIDETIINGIMVMHSTIISECIEYVNTCIKGKGHKLTKRFRDDQIDDVVKSMSIREIFTPIDYEYILYKFFVRYDFDKKEGTIDNGNCQAEISPNRFLSQFAHEKIRN